MHEGFKDNLEGLKDKKVILFGAGHNGKIVLDKLLGYGITPAYFVDNNPDVKFVKTAEHGGGGACFSVKTPEMLLSEDKNNLKIIITPGAPWYDEIEVQLKENGFGEHIFSKYFICCDYIVSRIAFLRDKIYFCCTSDSNFNAGHPEFLYMDTAEKTIGEFINKRDTIIRELNNRKYDISKPCVTCSRLKKFDMFVDEIKIKLINISCYPYICNGKCIYCGVYNDPENILEVAKKSNYPKMITEIIFYLRKNNIIDEKCLITFAPGEISVMPHRDLLLTAIAGYRAYFCTNAYIFNQGIADSLKNDGSSIIVSLDSGTRKTFKHVKGLDSFEEVVGNLKRYRENGNVALKYIIIAGVNDSDQDIGGFVGVVKLLNLTCAAISFEYYLPTRIAFLGIAKLVRKLTENGLSFSFHTYYTPSQINKFIDRYLTPSYKRELEQKNHRLHDAFYNEYSSNYEAYKQYVYVAEFTELIYCFKSGTRFALLGTVVNDKYAKNIILAFEQLGIPLEVPDLPSNESYSIVKNCADIFIICDKNEYGKVKACMESDGVDDKRLLNVEEYYYSFEPTKLFLDINIANEYLAR